MEEIKFYLEEAKESMEKALGFTSNELMKIRAGKANPGMLNGIHVEYYGSMVPLQQIATVNISDARSMVIKPFEKKLISDVERAIINSDLGLSPQNDGEQIRLNIPTLTEERRRDLVKMAKNECESGKIRIRNIRKETNDELKKLLKEGASEDSVKEAETKVQQLTDTYIGKIDHVLSAKEQEIMTV